MRHTDGNFTKNNALQLQDVCFYNGAFVLKGHLSYLNFMLFKCVVLESSPALEKKKEICIKNQGKLFVLSSDAL